MLLYLAVISICKFYFVDCDFFNLKILGREIRGEVKKTQNTGSIFYSFRGIGYGKAERFEEATLVDSWEGVYDATTEKPSCIQVFYDFNLPDSEDCLFLSVFTPQVPKSNTIKLLPVMFWIPGGFFLAGDSLYKNFGPDYLLEENVVVVTINYRLGIFGFLSSGDRHLPGNIGIKDCVLALKWVQKNIKFFGGNPGNVTIFGESAGAVISSYLTFSPLTQDKGYFQRAILQTGTALALWSFKENPKEIFDIVATSTMCGLFFLAGTQTVLNCLKSIPNPILKIATNFVLTVKSVLFMGILRELPFSPVLEEPSETAAITELTYKKLLGGDTKLMVPIINGINSEEFIAFTTGLNFLFKPRFDLLLQDIVLPKDMYITDPANMEKPIQIIKDYYFRKGLLVTPSTEEWIRFLSDSYFIRQWRQYTTMVEKITSTYCYIFSYASELGLKFQHPILKEIPTAK